MKGIRQIAKACFYGLILLSAISDSPAQLEEPVSLHDLSEKLRLTVKSALSLPPPDAKQSQEFLSAFTSDRYLRDFPHPRGEILEIANGIWYLWQYRAGLLRRTEALRKSKKGNSERIDSDPFTHDLGFSPAPSASEPTEEEQALLQTYKEQEKGLLERMDKSFTALEESAKEPENQKFALPINSKAWKAFAKLEEIYEPRK